MALDASDVALGAWLRLAVHAADLELGEGTDDIGDGRIPACKPWSDRAWLRAVGTDRAAVDAVVSAGLAKWDDGDLLVAGYDLKGQHAIQAKRKGGRKGGRPRKNHSKTTDEPEQNDSSTTDEPDPNLIVTGSKPLSFPSPSSPLPSEPRASADGDSDPNTPTGRQVLEAFAEAYTKGTKRREFAKGIDAARAGDLQRLREMRDKCDGDVADFVRRIAAQMTRDAKFASGLGIGWWATTAMDAPEETPEQASDPRMDGEAYQVIR